MGYADAVPDEAVEKKSVGYWNGWRQLLLPVLFFISGGELDESKDSLSVGDTCFSIGKIITRSCVVRNPSLSLPRLPEPVLKGSSIRCSKRGIW